MHIINRQKSSIRQLTQDYGMLAVGVYAGLSFSTFCGCLYSVTYMGITQEDISKVWNRLRGAIGLETNSSQPKDDGESTISTLWKKMPAWAQTPENSQRVTNVLLAMGMTKLFSPLKLAITAMIVPPLGKRLVAKGLLKRK